MPPVIRLVALPATTIGALARGDLPAANEASPVALGPWFAGDDQRSAWRRRSLQLAADPRCAAWITRVVQAVETDLAVGRAGFHGPPELGTAELGYAIDPEHQGRGYAKAALRALIDQARASARVRVIRVTIRPDNLASRAVIRGWGFVEIGEQEDPEDGLETIYELGAQHDRARHNQPDVDPAF